MLKRSGRCHDPEGANTTSQGELAIECPACPHPDRNLPSNWNAESSNQYVPHYDPNNMIDCFDACYRYLYTLFLGVDGNFKLRLKERGITDPELAPGWAYFVEENNYQAFIKDFIDQPEVYYLFISFFLFLLINICLPSRLAHASQNMMHWSELLCDLHQAIRLLV